MNFKTSGFITEISEIETLPNGGKKLTYQVNQETEHNNLLTLEVYKSADHAEHVDNFVKFNSVGDRVEVEFNVRQREYQGKIYSNVSHWQLNKLTGEENAIQGKQLEAEQVVDEDDSGLPF